MNYGNYRKARDKAWEVLLVAGIRELPVSISKIAKVYNILIYKYSDNIKYIKDNNLVDYMKKDGFMVGHKIFVNDKLPLQQIRFVIAHEIGHILLKHIFKDSSELEKQANAFASRILMPVCVLNELNVSTVEQIIRLCNVSKSSAKIRLERLNLLKKRNKFMTSDLEKQVLDNFKSYINRKA